MGTLLTLPLKFQDVTTTTVLSISPAYTQGFIL